MIEHEEARTALAFVAMHPNRRRDLEERFGSPEPLLQAVIGGKIKMPEYARQAATVPFHDRVQQLLEADKTRSLGSDCRGIQHRQPQEGR